MATEIVKSPGAVTVWAGTPYGTLSWSSLNANREDGNCASVGLAVSGTYDSKYMYARAFSHNIPSNATIKGIKVEIKKALSYSGTPKDFFVKDNVIKLVRSNAVVGSNKANTTGWTQTLAYTSYGGSDDLWGTTWTPAQINDDYFGIAISAQLNLTGSVSVTALVDHVRVTVYYTTIASVNGVMNIDFNGVIARQAIFNRSESIDLVLGGKVMGLKVINPSTIEQKTYMYKVYDENNNFMEVLDDPMGEPNFTQEINSMGSSTTINLARNSLTPSTAYSEMYDEDNQLIIDENEYPIITSSAGVPRVGPDSSIQHNNRVDIFVFYGESAPILDSDGAALLDEDGDVIYGMATSPNGVRIFTGFIAEINVKYGGDEVTQLGLMSYGFDLDQYVVTNNNKTTVAFNSYSPSNIVKGLLDLFKAQGSPDVFIDYTNISIQNITDYTTSYTFKNNTYNEALKKCIELAPSDWYFYVDLGTNLFNFKQKGTEANHTFILGKHIKELDLVSYIGDVVNDVYYTGGGDPALYKRYTTEPLPKTRRGLKQISDSRVTLETSAEIISQGEIAANKNIQYRCAVSILEKVYDIESIKIGDMVTFRNIDIEHVLMQVVGINYTPSMVTLQLDTSPSQTDKRLEDIKRNLKTTDNANIPDSP